MAITSKKDVVKQDAAVVEKPQSSKPGAKPEAEQPKGRVRYPGLKVDGEGNVTERLKEIPKDYDRTQHHGLRKGDFEHSYHYFEWRADMAEQDAKTFRERAQEDKALGSQQDRAKRKRLLQLQKQANELKEQLKSDGVDVSELLKALDA